MALKNVSMNATAAILAPSKMKVRITPEIRVPFVPNSLYVESMVMGEFAERECR
jgi:hypothetical protein